MSNVIKVTIERDPTVRFLNHYVVVTMNGSQLSDWTFTRRGAKKVATRMVRNFQAQQSPRIVEQWEEQA